MEKTRWANALAACAGSVILGIALPAGAAFTFVSEAVCIDNGAVQEGIAGGIAAPSAACDYSVSRTSGINRRIGSASASAQGMVAARAVGVDVSVDATLSTAFPTVFGANAVADARIDDMFIVTGTMPLGSALGAGLMDISAVASGQIRLDTTGSATLNTRALLNYVIAVGSAGTSATEIVFLGDLLPGEIRLINVPFIIPAVPFLAGTAIAVQMSARAELFGELSDDGSIDARVQFGNSLDWLGITRVTDAAGTPVASFSAVSLDTGTDWGALAPIPEPAAGVLFLAGLGVIGLFARRQRRQ